MIPIPNIHQVSVHKFAMGKFLTYHVVGKVHSQLIGSDVQNLFLPYLDIFGGNQNPFTSNFRNISTAPGAFDSYSQHLIATWFPKIGLPPCIIHSSIVHELPSGKLTQLLKMTHLQLIYLLKMMSFHSYVNLPEGFIGPLKDPTMVS